MFSHRFSFGDLKIIQAPHVDNEGDVFNHDEAVCYSDASEDHVDGVPHLPVGEHQDVGKVEQGAQHAHQHRKPIVDWIVKVLEMYDCRNLFKDEIVSP